ncbi:MAG: ABC transporter permease subunit, partial [Planctomycetota bacterium]|jgi:hypothetical protein
VQRKLWFRAVVSVIAAAACIGYFGTLIRISSSLGTQRTALVTALSGQNFQRGDEHAVQFMETGTVLVAGRLYGGEDLVEQAPYYFDAAGNLQPWVIGALLADQRPHWAGSWMINQPGTAWLLLWLSLGWCALIIWLGILLPFVVTALGTGLAAALLQWTGHEQLALAVLGMGLLTFTFVLLTRLALGLLNWPRQVPGVAHTVLKEASRIKISLAFIILLLIVLPLIPTRLDPASPLRFRIQTFISWSMGLTYFTAAFMTLFFTCATLAFEIRDRQIWQLMTKPVSKLGYLLGKWSGVMVINLILLLVASVSIFTFVQYLRSQPVAPGRVGEMDRLAVDMEVLTAREARQPVYERLTGEQLRVRTDDFIQGDPDLSREEEVAPEVRRQIASELQQAYLNAQRSVLPRRTRTYRFQGLERARASSPLLTLRYRFHILRDDEHETFRARFLFNERAELAFDSEFVPTMTHTLQVPSQYIRDDGTLLVTIVNPQSPPPDRPGVGAINFEVDDFELLYKVANFEGNFLRAVLVTWIKLAFLAALAICCATFLSFPVACLAAFTIFIAATLGPFLAESLEIYFPPRTENVDWSQPAMILQWALQSVTRWIAQLLVFTLSGFGEYRPGASLVEGRLIPWRAVGVGLFKIGAIWSGLSLAIGYLVIRSRQLAIYSGQG